MAAARKPHSGASLDEGVSFLKRGRTSKAKSCLEGYHKARPDSARGLSYLGVAIALNDKDYKAGEDYCFRAVLRNMKDAQLHANLALVYHLQGKRRSTVESLDEALARDPENADALRIYRVIGRRQRPPVPGLGRAHPVNRTLGKIVHRVKKGR
jgi:Flp pilus assembly protein TadD